MTNHLLKPLMCLLILGVTNKPSMDQVLSYVYKTDYRMEEHDPKINNTNIFPPETHQFPGIIGDDYVDPDTLAPGAEDDYYSSAEESRGDDSDKESEFGADDIVPKTQDHVIDPRSNCVCVLKIWSHFRLNFFNNTTITAQCLSPLKFVYENASSDVEYSHTLACDRQVLKMFCQG